MKRILIATLLCAVFLAPSWASGALITDVQSSFDKDDPFDMALFVSYENSNQSTRLTREYLRDGTTIDFANKLLYEETSHTVRFDVAIGLYRDFELVVDLPLIAQSQGTLDFHPAIPQGGNQEYKYTDDIDPSVYVAGHDAATKKETLFDIPHKGKERSGLGDIGLGIRWAPWHYKRDHQYPSWIIGVMFTLPTAPIKKADNADVGEGVFAARINTAISRRVAPFFEPYFDVHGVLKVATARSLFDTTHEGFGRQTLTQPGNEMGLKFGAEFIPWEVAAEDRHVAIDLGVGLDYIFEGREYTELFEALGSSPCLPSNDCWGSTYSQGPKGYTDEINYKKKHDQNTQDVEVAKGKAKENNTYPRTDGITDVEHYGVYSFWAGLDVQPIQYLALGTRFNMAYSQPHFITFADAGKDSGIDNDDVVTGYNNNGENEYNPKYIEELDQIGNRFKASRSFNWALIFSLAGKF